MRVGRVDFRRACIPDTGRSGLAEARMPFHRCSVTPSRAAYPPAAAGR